MEAAYQQEPVSEAVGQEAAGKMSDVDRQLLLALKRERDQYKKALERIAGGCTCIDTSKCPSCVAEAALRRTGSR